MSQLNGYLTHFDPWRRRDGAIKRGGDFPFAAHAASGSTGWMISHVPSGSIDGSTFDSERHTKAFNPMMLSRVRMPTESPLLYAQVATEAIQALRNAVNPLIRQSGDGWSED
jgi:hypothetical protein